MHARPPPADQFPEEKRERYCRKAQKLVGATLAATRFAGCPVVPVAARPGAGSSDAGAQGAGGTVGGGGTQGNDSTGSAGPSSAPVGMQQLIETLLERVRLRPGAAPAIGNGSTAAAAGRVQPVERFLFYVDHCFAIRGQGTVLTGGPAGGCRTLQERRRTAQCAPLQARPLHARPAVACAPAARGPP